VQLPAPEWMSLFWFGKKPKIACVTVEKVIQSKLSLRTVPHLKVVGFRHFVYKLHTRKSTC
jgi:hypothetical protein